MKIAKLLKGHHHYGVLFPSGYEILIEPYSAYIEGDIVRVMVTIGI